ncbi:hypothetical protein ACHHYP_02402 [Achlya hypogyna]|uniref:VWFA domain-containing protein n=1 Tax=Achlya hypogyna TaxID=1202772 RepID=A0A1V9ZS42_ACHHY|nr:hypothetical protein ACHHYP_02402 [Achlya hypogyna]
MSYEELKCYHLLDTVLVFDDGSEVFQPTLNETELFRLLRALGVVDTDAASPESQLGRFVNACLNGAVQWAKDPMVVNGLNLDLSKYNRSIDVVACYGKQAAVEADLRAQGWWPTKLETYLHSNHEGVYAVLVSEISEIPKLVLFTWLCDSSFEPKLLRERATYALRFLTTLTPTVRCCLGDEDWNAIERAASETRSESSKKKRAVEFSITEATIQDENISCEVASTATTKPGDTLVAAVGAVGVTMHLSHDHVIRTTSKSISLASPAVFSKWFVDVAATHRIQIQVQLPRKCKRAVLKELGLLPIEKLSSISTASLEADLRAKAIGEAEVQLATSEAIIIEAAAKLFYLQNSISPADEAEAEKTLQTQKKALKLSLTDTVELPPFDLIIANIINDEYNRLLNEAPEALATAKRLSSWLPDMVRSRLPTFLRFPFLKTHKTEMELILPSVLNLLRESYETWCKDVRAFFQSTIVVEHTTTRCYNALLTKSNMQEKLRGEKEAIVNEAFVEAIEAANAKHSATHLCVRLTQAYNNNVNYLQEYHAGGAMMLTLTPVGNKPVGNIKLPKGADVIDVNAVVDVRTVVVVVFTMIGKTHVHAYEANGARSMTQLIAKEYPTLVERCDFDPSHRLLALKHSEKKVDIFRFSESFKVLERAHQYNLHLLGPTAPYKAFSLFGGDNHGLFVVGDDGSAQSYFLRTQQQSLQVRALATPETKIVKVQNGAFMVCIELLDADEGCRLCLRTLESQSHEMLPLVAEVTLPRALHWPAVQARAYDDKIVLLESSSGAVVVLKMTIVTGKVALEVTCGHRAAPMTACESHVLAPLFHVFEKFPVSAFMTQDDNSDDSDEEATVDAAAMRGNSGDLLPTTLKLHLKLSSSKQRKSAVSVLKSIMNKLKKLNKRLASLSLAENAAINEAMVWPTMHFGRWLLELIGFVPVPICRARDNELELLRDGNVVTLSDCAEVHQMVPWISFGPTSYILKAWRGPIVAITSMGKQSTGKSYFLNHLTGSSFAISGARCTDGVWLTLRPYGDTLVVVLDFEGLGSFERSMQEDTLLSVLNAAISQLTIFRIEMRFDKDIDAMFAKFQQGVTMLKGDERLFSGRLYMNAKDVNPNDTDALIGEFDAKLKSGRVLVTACAPLNNVGYYDGLMQAATCLAEARDRNTFSSGADFHECLACVLAKIARRDWTSMDENIAAGKLVLLREQIRYALRNGELDAASMTTSTELWPDDDDRMAAQRQTMGISDMIIPLDADIDFGLELDAPIEAAINLSVAKKTFLYHMERYLQHVAALSEDDHHEAEAPRLITAPRRVDHEARFGVLWSYIVWRREYRVRAWFESLGVASRQELLDEFNSCVQMLKQLLRRCEHNGTCTTDDHFHVVDALHFCDKKHACQADCTAPGICDIKVKLEVTPTEFVNAEGSFTYMHHAMNSLRKKCAVEFHAGCVDHKGIEHCCNDVHTCDARCPCCGYYCTKLFQHAGVHTTTHGNMTETTFVMDIDVLQLEKDRKYVAGDHGVAEMCPFFRTKLGRGHVHYVPCMHESADACTHAAKDGRRHSKMTLATDPTQAMDEVLHDTYWKMHGWEDPVSSALERKEFALCPYECEAPERKEGGGCKSHCILGAWHEPVVDVGTLSSTQTLVQGHVFNCQHFAGKGLHHHVFVLDASGSMKGLRWAALTKAYQAYVNQLFQSRSQNCADIVSVITFSWRGRIVYEAQPLVKMVNISLPLDGYTTNYDEGLRCANDVLSRNDHTSYTPVMLFFSDGMPDANATWVSKAQHIAKTYAIYNLQSSCVGFGDSNFAHLQSLATCLGGTFKTAKSDSDLLTTFKDISIASHAKAGLVANTRPTEAA